jgi:hypothetical protein
MRPPATRIGTFVAALLVVLCARDGVAQSSAGSPPVFAGASAAWNIDNSAYGSERTGGALAVGATFGTNFADRWSVQVEGEWPTSAQTVVNQFSWGSGYGSQTYTAFTRTAVRTPTVAVLFGVHWRLPKRVDIGFQFGPCFRYEQRDRESQYFVNGILDHSYQYSENGWRNAISLGVETAVALTPRVAVVGQLRVHWRDPYHDSEQGPVWRPAVGVRVRF